MSNKEKEQEQAQKLIDYSLNLLAIQYNSEGVVMSKKECIPKAKIVARSHINFLLGNSECNKQFYFYWKNVEFEIDNTF